jgi:hypothetical protein
MADYVLDYLKPLKDIFCPHRGQDRKGIRLKMGRQRDLAPKNLAADTPYVLVSTEVELVYIIRPKNCRPKD